MGYILRQYKRYAVLARGCLGAGSIEKAANVVRAAYRLNPQGLSMPQRAPGVEMRARGRAAGGGAAAGVGRATERASLHHCTVGGRGTEMLHKGHTSTGEMVAMPRTLSAA